ncbi:MAG: thioredoxin domain-containing protein [Candidatus Woesearchaeota archaeon]
MAKKKSHKKKEGHESTKENTSHTGSHSSGRKKAHDNVHMWKAATAVLALLLLISIITGGFSSSSGMSKEDASEKTLDYINENLLQGQAVASVENIQELDDYSCLYNVSLSVQGQSFQSYVTKDGGMLFPQAINMEAPVPTPDQGDQQAQQQDSQIPKKADPEVLLFTMSYCPYGNQAEEGIGPVAEALSGDLEVEPHYVIYSDYRGGGPEYCLDEESKYCSMHGVDELKQNVRELCIYKYEQDKYWDYVLDVNNECSVQDIETCWEGVAEEHGIDTEKIKTCEEEEAMDMLAEEVSLNKEYEVRGSPTLMINDAKYSGQRTPESYKTAICSGFESAPESCAEELSDEGSAAAGQC